MPQTFVKSFRSVLLFLRPPLSVKLCRLDARLRSCFKRARRFFLITQLALMCTTFTGHEFNKADDLMDHVTTLWSWKVFWNVVKWEIISGAVTASCTYELADSELAEKNCNACRAFLRRDWPMKTEVLLNQRQTCCKNFASWTYLTYRYNRP